jgi:hypothetical protein
MHDALPAIGDIEIDDLVLAGVGVKRLDLQAGDRIVTAGANLLVEDQVVRVLADAAAPAGAQGVGVAK